MLISAPFVPGGVAFPVSGAQELVPPSADAHTAVIPAKEVVAKGPEKKGTTKGTKKSFSFVALVPLWFKAFMPFATPSFVGMTVVVCGVGVGFNASVH